MKQPSNTTTDIEMLNNTHTKILAGILIAPTEQHDQQHLSPTEINDAYWTEWADDDAVESAIDAGLVRHNADGLSMTDAGWAAWVARWGWGSAMRGASAWRGNAELAERVMESI